MKLIKLTLLSLSLFSLSLHAHEEGQLGMLKGEHLGLYYTDHAMSGHVNGTLVFASPLEKEFGLQITHRQQGRDFKSEFKTESGGTFSGVLTGINKEGTESQTEVSISKVNGKMGTIEGTVGTKAFKVQISSKSMVGNHYVNPEYHVTLPNREYRFQLENGMACIGCSVKIVYAVLGMLEVSGAL